MSNIGNNSSDKLLSGADLVQTGVSLPAGSTAVTPALGDNSTSLATTAFTTRELNNRPLSYRNKIINGDMQVSQVNGGSAVTPAGISYPIDQWKVSVSQPSKITVQQVVDAPAGFKYSIKLSVSVQYAPVAADYFQVYQPIEGQNIIDLGFGTSGASTIAVSLWIKGSVTGTYACNVGNGVRSYIGSVNVTTIWAKQTVILVADTSGVWATDNAMGVALGIDLGSGTNLNSPVANAWQTGSYSRSAGPVTFVNQVAGSTLNITGVQLEKVSVGATSGTEFEHVSYADQLRWCQRYLPSVPNGGTSSIICPAYTFTTTLARGIYKLSVPTRVPVTGLLGSNSTYFSFQGVANFGATIVTIFAGGSASTDCVAIDLTSAGMTAGQGGSIYFNNVLGSLYFTGAQL